MALSRSSFANELDEYFSSLACRRKRLLAFASGVSLGPQVGRGAASRGEEAREDGLDERAEYDLSTAGDWERHPEDQDELEGVVEGYNS